MIVGLSAAALVIVLGIAVVGFALVGNVGPFKDSGLAACEAIRDRAGVNKSTDSNSRWTAPQYQAVRKQFAGSRYGDIRDAGTHLVDLLWQLSQAGSNDSAGLALFMGGQILNTYASLSGACANHGVILPAIGSSRSP